MPRESCPVTSKPNQKQHTAAAEDDGRGLWSWGRGQQGLKQWRRKGRERSEESRKRSKACQSRAKRTAPGTEGTKEAKGKTPARGITSTLTKRQKDHGGVWA